MPSKNSLLPTNEQKQSATVSASGNETIDSNHPDRVVFRDGVAQDQSINSTNNMDNHLDHEQEQSQIINEDDEPITQPIVPIHSKTKNWYSNFCNRWASLFGAIIKIVIMMLVNVYYGALCIGVVFLVWFYVGTANPAVKPGIAAEFRLFVWLKGLVFRCFG